MIHRAMFHRKPYFSIEEAAVKPADVRRLWLIRPCVAFDAFSTLLSQLTNVREIRLGWQSWTELPHELSELREFRSLTVLNSPIQSFPAFLGSCPHLSELVLRGTDIARIPVSVQTFRHLHRLDFSNNPVREIPPELGELSELRELQLADDGLETLPESLNALRRLHRLALAGNSFSAVEASRVRGWFAPGVVLVWGRDEVAA